VEPLEDRTLPATFYAATVSDLIADIQSANTGGGSNSIILTAPATSPYALTAADNSTDGPTGLPVIAWGNDLTIVGNGDTIERSTDPATPNFRLLVVASGASLTLQNLTLQNGVAESDGTLYGTSFGGGIYNQGSLTLSGVTVQYNQALGSSIYRYLPGDPYGSSEYIGGDAYGGGVASFGALTLLDGTRIHQNFASGGRSMSWVSTPQGGAARGGGVYVGGGTANLTGATLSGNGAEGGAACVWWEPDIGTSSPGNGGQAYGGGLYVDAGTVTLSGSTVSSNQAIGGSSDDDGLPPGTGGGSYGGGIYVGYGSVTLYRDIVQNNNAMGGWSWSGTVGVGSGGGLYIVAPVPSMVCLDTFTESNTINNTPDNIVGPYFLNGAPVPVLAISDVSILEGNSGTTAFVFTVNLSAPSGQPVTVNYATADGSATSGNDYTAASGTLTIPAGQTSGTITVLVNGDRVVEPNETFFINLSSPTNATIAGGQGQGTIVDDEPRVSINDVTMNEGNSGLTAFAFTVSLSVAYDVPVTVSYATANGIATAGSDYQAQSGTLTIPAGQTSGTITVLVNGDRLAEPNETFFVNLSNVNYGVIADGQGVGTILDDEPRISISDVTRKEGNGNKTTLFTFTVTLSYRTVDGTATTSDGDYVAKTGTLTFAPGETTKTITIEVKGDSKKEANETFYLDLFYSSINSLFTKNRGLGTILNDD
jgi:hypothetical protein